MFTISRSDSKTCGGKVGVVIHATKKFEMTSSKILDLDWEAAQNFLLTKECYCDFDLPQYFNFEAILKKLAESKDFQELTNFEEAKNRLKVNYILYTNKDQNYAWRPLQLIHPVLYVALVQKITKEENWQEIQQKFPKASSEKIECVSLPIVGKGNKYSRGQQINNWVKEVQQKSLELALDFEYLHHTDISECYGSIYTHTIAWALHGKTECKNKLKKSDNKKSDNKSKKWWLGEEIDNFLRCMSHGQTNSIPQGSVLMDFIAEMVLGYADKELEGKLKDKGFEYKILRYRDDYRIFTNSKKDGAEILKILTEVLIDLGLKINPAKTKSSSQIIRDSIKPDKLYWIVNNKLNLEKSRQKKLLIIHDFAEKFPNSGTLTNLLIKFFEKEEKAIYQQGFRKILMFIMISNCQESFPNNLSSSFFWYFANYAKGKDSKILISILADIAIKNFRAIPKIFALISLYLSYLESDEEKIEICKKIKNKFQNLPNVGHLEIWLQRLTIKLDRDQEQTELLCKMAKLGDGNKEGKFKKLEIWNCDWSLGNKIKLIINKTPVIDEAKIEEISSIFSKEEVDVFAEYYS